MMENKKLQVLLSKMTVKQKVAQLLQLNPFYFEADRNEEQITGYPCNEILVGNK